MTDSATPAPTTPQKSPLDLLEDILNESKNAGGAADPAAAAAAEAEAIAAQQAEKISQMQAQNKVADEQAIEQGIAELSSIKDTPAYQARIQQEAATVQAHDQQADAQRGFEIKQLSHKKI